MARQYASLEQIENNRKITRETDGPFLYRLQSGLLLALKEQGRLSEIQYRHAQEHLERQRLTGAKHPPKDSETP